MNKDDLSRWRSELAPIQPHDPSTNYVERWRKQYHEVEMYELKGEFCIRITIEENGERIASIGRSAEAAEQRMTLLLQFNAMFRKP